VRHRPGVADSVSDRSDISLLVLDKQTSLDKVMKHDCKALLVYVLYKGYYAILNKRAQRALGRSPEEKVKGNSGANSREPKGHNLNNFGRGPFDDVIN